MATFYMMVNVRQPHRKMHAIRKWTVKMIQTSKQMKGFFGLVNWYSIYIQNYADLAAPLMESL